MEEADGVGEGVLDQHPFGVTSDELLVRGGFIVCQKDGWQVVPKVLDEELSERPFMGLSLLLEDARRSILALWQVEIDGAPGGGGQVMDLLEQSRGAAAQGDESDVVVVEAVEVSVGCELGIEDQMLRRSAVLALPERDEAEDLVGLLAFAEIGVGVAEDVAVGVLGEEGENAGLAAAALGEVVGLDLRVLAEVGHGVEVEIEGLCGEDVAAGDLVVPRREQALDLAGRDA